MNCVVKLALKEMIERTCKKNETLLLLVSMVKEYLSLEQKFNITIFYSMRVTLNY